MSPARRRQIYFKKRQKKTKGKIPFAIFIFAAVIIGILLFILRKGMWAVSDNFSLVIAKDSGEVIVASFDKKSGKITSVYIPGSTQVSVSRDLGTWRLKSVWKLGEQEGLGGDLLRETIVKNFHFPVLAYVPEEGVGFASGKLRDLWRAVLVPYKSNLTFNDKLRLAFFSLNTKSTKRVDLNLEDAQFLKPTKFVDGSQGYVISNLIPKELLAVFSDRDFIENNMKIRIKDSTNAPGIAESVARTLEFLGGKVASLEREEGQNIDCEVSGKDKSVLKRISLLLGCSSTSGNSQSNFDLDLRLGKNFASRY